MLALEALAAAQALDLRAPLEPGPATRAVHDAIRASVPFFEADREFGPDIADAVALVRRGALVIEAARVLDRPARSTSGGDPGCAHARPDSPPMNVATTGL